jgi:hypothetical protein
MDCARNFGLVGLVLVSGLGVSSCMGGSNEGERALEGGTAAQSGVELAQSESAAASVGERTAGPSSVDSTAAGQARAYAVDQDQSEVYWRIYRAGLMARLGHNHVISAGQLDGSVTMGGDPSATTWSLTIPVQGLVVDDPSIRARHGQDFSSEPSQNDVEGTKTNMLSEGVLNGEVYAEIRLRGTGFTGSLADAMLPVEIELLGRTIPMTLPAAIEIEGDAVTVSGEFRLTHTELGMMPFTALGGAMSVGEEIDFSYRIHAVAGDR